MTDNMPPSAPTDQPQFGAPVNAGQAPRVSNPNSTMGDTNGANTPIADLSSAAAAQVRPGGAPARVYLNENIVPHLLEGMKSVAKDQPVNPLRVLGEFLIQKSNELESDAKKDTE
ncbi:hypothetical protein N7478_011275 [Penicillium angulare]|uniref:uncharacterized protein n=1 Tax=Penicillium angulare TaxID=116970 RepID=UPI0025406625|nr:uncharacterized protein N7478_011275 [Penicillium angulare]KAJ5263670.1 hypothetical protein N7478_011275 [Penicillium angulare]